MYGKLVLDLDGWDQPPAVIGANNIVTTATILGGDWIWDCPSSKMRYYAPMTKSSAESMNEAWSILTEQIKNAAPAWSSSFSSSGFSSGFVACTCSV